MANNKPASTGQNSAGRFELIPAPPGADSGGTGSWPQMPLGGFDGQNGGGSGNPSRYLHALRRRWLMAVILALPISAAAAWAVWSYMPRQYTATAILRLSSSENALLFQPADGAAGAGNTFDAYKRTQRQLLRSRFVITPALRDGSLANVPVLLDQRDAVEWLENNLSVSFPDESELMYVSLSAANAEGLHQLVNGVVQAYLDEFVFTEAGRKRDRLNSLELAHTKVELDLKPKRAELKELEEKFGAGSAAPFTAEQQKASQKYDEFQKQLAKLQSELIQARSELEIHEAAVDAEDGDFEISDQELRLAMRNDPEASRLEAEKKRVANYIEATRRSLKPGVPIPNLARYEADLESLKEKLEARKQELRPEIIEHRRQIAVAAIGGLKAKIAQLTGLESQYVKKAHELEADLKSRRPSNDVEDLRREIAHREQILNGLGVELERTKVELQAELERAKEGLEPDSRISSSRVKQWSKAQPAHIADAKSRVTKTIVAGLAGLALPILFIVWLDVRRDCISSRDEIERGLGLSVIGAVPMIPLSVMRRLNGSSSKHKYWRTLLSESVDSIAAVLLRGMRSGTIRTVMVSSATAGEGKTTLAANLATSLAGAGRRTVLIDFDLRRPALPRVFDLALTPGINDVLRDTQAFHSAIQLTQIPNLSFLAAGRWSATGLAGLAVSDLKSLFDRLKDEFEFIVVDGSPILPVVDTRLIAQHVDTVIISVLRDTSRIPQVRTACDLLEKFAVPVLGVVITGSKGDAYPDSSYSQYAGAQAV
jgi:succinoglycan biosynthesis transport protein ExoP